MDSSVCCRFSFGFAGALRVFGLYVFISPRLLFVVAKVFFRLFSTSVEVSVDNYLFLKVDGLHRSVLMNTTN